uniref:Uncharacterized protein n=1 Tax=Trypanosoma congolense (strain IL3000) TaxID=1068625 RepID=G0V0Z8_TRYCI|nr:hypothetical protein, unlikely [Trypanosoma congolense IL3000]
MCSAVFLFSPSFSFKRQEAEGCWIRQGPYMRRGKRLNVVVAIPIGPLLPFCCCEASTANKYIHICISGKLSSSQLPCRAHEIAAAIFIVLLFGVNLSLLFLFLRTVLRLPVLRLCKLHRALLNSADTF